VTVEIKILGVPELIVDQRRVAIAPQLWSVLLSLVQAPNVAVPLETIIDHLWEDDPPPKARSTARSYLSRLDRALAQDARGAAMITRKSLGYALMIDPDAVDLHRFRDLVLKSDTLAESGETRQAALLLQKAEALWRGTALAGLPGDWTGRIRDTLSEEHRSATWQRIDLDLTLGRHTQLLGELAELSRSYPEDEALARYCMLALFRAGRQADALRVYREIQARLAAEGMEPDPELSVLYQRILRHDRDIAVTPAYRSADRGAQPDTLLAGTSDFTGRVEETRFLLARAGHAGQRVFAVIEGMGGIGKTALALHAGRQAASRYPDAQIYIDMSAHSPVREPLDPIGALLELLRMLGVPPRLIPDTLEARAGLWRAELSGRRAVIILDDVVGPDQIRLMLPGEDADCLLIATSRQRHVDWGADRVVPLKGLPDGDAVTLFTRVAGPAAATLDHAAQTIRRYLGLPLAIRIAASQPSLFDAPDPADTLSEPATDDVAEIGRQLQPVFELSYRRLSPRDRRVFRYLAASPCLGFSARTAAVLSGLTAAEADAALGNLSGQSLLEEEAPGWFAFHDLVRSFAKGHYAREEADPEVRQAIARLAGNYLLTVVRLPADWLEAEWRNVLSVAEYCGRQEWKQRCADLVHELAQFMETSGHWGEALNAQRMALDASRDMEDLGRAARAAYDLSLTCLRTGHTDEALQCVGEAAAAFDQLGDQRGRAKALDWTGVVHRNAARFRAALAYHQEAMALSRAADDQVGIGGALLHAATALAALGRYSEEMAYLSEALGIFRLAEDQRGEALALNNIGIAQYRLGLHRDAMRNYQQSHRIFSVIGGEQNLALLEQNMGEIYRYKGKYDEAMVLYRKVLAVYRALGDRQHQARVLVDIGLTLQLCDKPAQALAHHERAVALADQVGDRYLRVKALCGIAEAHFGSSRPDAALERYEEAVRLASEIESLDLKARALCGMAETTLRIKGSEAARIYWREAHDIFTHLGLPEAALTQARIDLRV
jgi:DNA-binding SARP family transcriptional activator/tetratricopeptide (TPR) repeat protein